jgi:hypothetical protein
MARKYDDNVVWVPLNVEGWDKETTDIYQELRASWDVSKAIKVRLETRLAAKAAKEASTWPPKAVDEIKAKTLAVDDGVADEDLPATPFRDMCEALHVLPNGKFAPTHTLKFSYMRGVAMASVPVTKSKASKGLSI